MGYSPSQTTADRLNATRHAGTWAGRAFESLEKQEQLQFRNTKLPVVMVESDSTDSRNEARDLFIRLQAGMPLNAQEKRDA